MLIDVLQRVAADAGYHSVNQRASLVKLLQRGADELYKRLECNRIYREVTLVVTPNALVSLPAFIGPLRGVRAHTTDNIFPLNAMMQPRYTSGTWNYKVKNWREIGDMPVHTFVGAVGSLTLTIDTADPDVTVLVSGQTATASKWEEAVVMDGVTKVTTAQFGPTIFNISSQSERDLNITVYDMLGTEIAILYNSYPRTKYTIIDVSEVFWSADTAAGESWVDVCYKEPLTKLIQDSDLFPAGDDYDNAWYNMAMHLHYLPQEKRKQDAKDHLVAALADTIADKESAESQMEKKLNFGPNKFYDLVRRGNCYPGAITNVDANVP